jgi:branched-chain amino acid transport system substrate-binding protein
MAEGVMGPSHWEYGVRYSESEANKSGLPWIGPGQDEFVALFKKAVGKEMIPDYHAAEAGAQVLAYALAVEKAGALDPKKVRSSLGDLTFMSFYGGWDIDASGMQVGHSMVDVQWQGGKRVIVWPPSAQTGKPYYPMPTFKEKAAGKMALP